MAAHSDKNTTPIYKHMPMRTLLSYGTVFLAAIAAICFGLVVFPIVVGTTLAVLVLIAVGIGIGFWFASRSVRGDKTIPADGTDWMSQALDSFPTPIFVQDTQHRTVLANEAFALLIGRDVSTIVGKNIADVVPASLASQLMSYDLDTAPQAWEQLDPIWVERVAVDQDGREISSSATRPATYIQTRRRVLFDKRGNAFIVTFCDDLTERQQLAKEQTERNERARMFLQRLIDVIPQPVYVKDAQSRYIFVNPAFCQQRMLPAEQIVGRPPLEFSGYDAQVASKVVEEDQRVLAGEGVFKEECFRHRVTGEERYRVITKGTCLDEEGKPVVIGTSFDTTNWRQAEKSLKSALATQSRMRAFLQSIFDALPNPLFVKDADHHVIMTNRAHAVFLGRAQDDVVGRSTVELVGAELAKKLDEFDDEVFDRNDGEVLQREVQFFDPQGSPRQFIVRKVSDHDVDGKRVVITIHVDITSLREAEARWQFALEGAGDGIWDWNVVDNRVFYSSRWKAMLGYDENDIGDSPDERFQRIHPDDIALARADLDFHLNGKTPIYVSEHRLRCKGGEYRWILDRGRVIERGTDGKPVRVIGTHTDITERKRFEEELRRHRDRLQDLVQEQTSDLMLAKEAAERASAAKSLFLANMSHELRTPMHAILSFARLGETKALDATPDKLQGYFERIRTSGDRLMLLLNDLLDLSKLEAGSMSLDIEALDLQSVIDDTLREFDAWLNARKLRVAQVKTCDGFILGDAIRMGQVIRNLLSNAIKFSPEGSQITLTLQTATLMHGLGFSDTPAFPAVEFILADEGPGIPANEIDTIFEKFVQSTTTRTGAGGTGLGLAICREIVSAHRGQIVARNRAGEGAEFSMRIPAASAKISLITTDRTEEAASTDDAQGNSNLRGDLRVIR